VEEKPQQSLGPRVACLAALHGLAAAGLLLALLVLWPRPSALVPEAERLACRIPRESAALHPEQGATDPDVGAAWYPCITGLGAPRVVSDELRVLLLVWVAGALGGFLHSAQSFASYVGNQEFKPSWTLWYALRMPIGAFLAVVGYFLIRGGLLSAEPVSSSSALARAGHELPLFKILGFSALAGLFSKQATDKLAEVFDTLFRSRESRRRKHRLREPAEPPVGAPPSPVRYSSSSFETDENLRDP
jgi:hypothetical protein